jgi:ketosteroid isomerase-like protein
MSARSVVAAVIKAWSAQDVETTVSYCSDDVVYALHISEQAVPFAGASEGKDAVRGTLHMMLEMFDYLKFDQRIVGFSGEVVRVQTQFKLHHRRTGENLECSMRTLFTVRNGAVTRCDEYLDEGLVETFMRLVRQREAENDVVAPPQIRGRSAPPKAPEPTPEPKVCDKACDES